MLLSNGRFQYSLRCGKELAQMIQIYSEIERLKQELNFVVSHMLKWGYQSRILVCAAPSELSSDLLKLKPNPTHETLIDRLSPEQIQQFQELLKVALGEKELSRQRWLWQKYKEHEKIIQRGNILRFV